MIVVVIALLVAGIAIGHVLTSSPSPAVASKVDPAVVDITTNLAYQGAGLAGTGVVLGSKGLVLTNNHVIEGSSTISARDVGNGHSYGATVLGTDMTDDLALIQLRGASHLRVMTPGDSAKLRVGQSVYGIGNAGGTGGTPSVAHGAITGLDVTINADDQVTGATEQLTGLIQTSVALEPGDSGGPLVDGGGRVIGIDTAGSTSYQFESGANQGFSIPINQALDVARQIESGKGSSTVHIGAAAFLGVAVVTSNVVAGALVTGVAVGSPAEAAGLSRGDVIVSLGGQAVDSASKLLEAVQSYRPGDFVQVTWIDPFGAQHNAGVRLTSGPPQ